MSNLSIRQPQWVSLIMQQMKCSSCAKWVSVHKLLERTNAWKLKNGEQMTDYIQLRMGRVWELTKWDEAYQHKW